VSSRPAAQDFKPPEETCPKGLPPRTRIPGIDPGIWILLLGDLLLFTSFFGTIAYYRGHELDVFVISQSSLLQQLGLINTVLLLTGSLFVALAQDRLVKDSKAALHIALAITCGCGFVCIKLLEYTLKIWSGVSISSNIFFTLYFAFTGIHLAHVVIGISLLGWSFSSVRSPRRNSFAPVLESIGLFWHMVDLLWVVLFLMFYLL
jgi:nitric oxide reductase NorE protein